jgi:hypothetical protein
MLCNEVVQSECSSTYSEYADIIKKIAMINIHNKLKLKLEIYCSR